MTDILTKAFAGVKHTFVTGKLALRSSLLTLKITLNLCTKLSVIAVVKVSISVSDIVKTFNTFSVLAWLAPTVKAPRRRLHIIFF